MHSRLHSLEAKLDSALNFGKYSDEWDVEQAKSIARQRAAGRQYRVDKKVDKKSAKEGYRKALDDDNRKVGVAGGRLIDNTHTLRGGAIGMAGGAAVGAMAGRKLAGRHGGKAGRIARVAGMAGGALHGGIIGGQLGLIPGSKIDKKPKKKEKSLEARIDQTHDFARGDRLMKVARRSLADQGFLNPNVTVPKRGYSDSKKAAKWLKANRPAKKLANLEAVIDSAYEFGSANPARLERVIKSKLKKGGVKYASRVNDAFVPMFQGKNGAKAMKSDPSIDRAFLKREEGIKRKLKRESARYENLSALLDTVDFTDPRPRDQTGQFSDVTTAGANPDAMRKAYGSQSRINPDALKKLKRKLPRAMAQSMI